MLNPICNQSIQLFAVGQNKAGCVAEGHGMTSGKRKSPEFWPPINPGICQTDLDVSSQCSAGPASLMVCTVKHVARKQNILATVKIAQGL